MGGERRMRGGLEGGRVTESLTETDNGVGGRGEGEGGDGRTGEEGKHIIEAQMRMISIHRCCSLCEDPYMFITRGFFTVTLTAIKRNQAPHGSQREDASSDSIGIQSH